MNDSQAFEIFRIIHIDLSMLFRTDISIRQNRIISSMYCFIIKRIDTWLQCMLKMYLHHCEPKFNRFWICSNSKTVESVLKLTILTNFKIKSISTSIYGHFENERIFNNCINIFINNFQVIPKTNIIQENDILSLQNKK